LAKYAKAAGGNWSAATTWSATSSAGVDNAGAPTAAEDVIFDSGAINTVTVDTTTCAAKSVTFQSADNKIAYTAAKALGVSGNYTQFAGMSVTGTGFLDIATTSSITSAGITFPGTLRFTDTTFTATLQDNWTVTGSVVVYTTTLLTLNGYQITSGGLVVSGPCAGTTNIINNGVWSGTNTTGIANNLTLGATATISGTVYYKTGTLTNNMNAGGAGTSTLHFTGSSTVGGTGSWYSVWAATADSTITLQSNLTCGMYLYFANVNVVFAGNFNISTARLITYSSVGVKTVTFVSGTTVTVSSILHLGSIVGVSVYAENIQSSIASSAFYLNYQGTQADLILVSVAFTDVNASGSVRPLYNYQGGALTRTSNIYNVVLPPVSPTFGLKSGGTL
jgi:hypothetical protein